MRKYYPGNQAPRQNVSSIRLIMEGVKPDWSKSAWMSGSWAYCGAAFVRVPLPDM